jgi:hypothetical protein
MSGRHPRFVETGTLPMTKPAQQHFEFDQTSSRKEPSSFIFAVDFLIPTILAACGVIVGYFWFS